MKTETDCKAKWDDMRRQIMHREKANYKKNEIWLYTNVTVKTKMKTKHIAPLNLKYALYTKWRQENYNK